MNNKCLDPGGLNQQRPQRESSLNEESNVGSLPISVGYTHITPLETLVQGPVKGETDARSKSAAVRQDSLEGAMERELAPRKTLAKETASA